MGIAPSLAVALFALVAGAAGAPEASPQVPTDRTYLTFACATQLPGAPLPPGTYLFVIVRSVGGQSLIDVYTADASQRVARVLGIDGAGAYETEPETGGCPPLHRPSRGWFDMPHARDIEFVYSRAEAGELSRTFGMQVPYSVLPVGDLDLVGAYPVAGVRRSAPLFAAGAGTMVPFPSEGSRLGALIATTGAAFRPVDHLRVARMIVAERAAAVARERTQLEQLGAMLDALQRAARERDAGPVDRLANGIEATIQNFNPPVQVLAKHGMLPPPRDFVLTLERVGAHVRAFTRASRAGR